MELLPGIIASPSPSSTILHCKSSAAAQQSCQVPPPTSLTSLITSSVVSLIASAPPSLALNYNEFITRTETAKPVAAASAAASAIGFDGSNPTVLFAGVAAVAVPFLAYRAYATPQPYGSVSALSAFTALSNPELKSVLLDVRAPEEVKASGVPDLKSIRKKAVQVAYRQSDDEVFVERVFARCRGAEDTTVYVLDGVDGSGVVVAKLLVDGGFGRAFAIKGGVDGPNGWQKSELPWLLPRKGLNLNLDGLKTLFSGSDNTNLVPATLGAAAAAGIGVAIFAEVETVLQLLGSAAFIQIFARKFMFADDRGKTIKELQMFLDTKIAPKEFVEELKEVGKILLPSEGGNRAAAVASENATSQESLKADSPATAPEESLPGNAAEQA